MSLVDETIPAHGGAAVTPSDTVDLSRPSRGVWVGVAGDVKATMEDGSVVTWPAAVAGVMHPLSCKRIWSTGTTATGIMVAY